MSPTEKAWQERHIPIRKHSIFCHKQQSLPERLPLLHAHTHLAEALDWPLMQAIFLYVRHATHDVNTHTLHRRSPVSGQAIKLKSLTSNHQNRLMPNTYLSRK